MKTSKAQASELLIKPYKRLLIPDEESGTFTAQIVEFPGCIAQGSSPAEAYERLQSAAESWIEAALEMQQEIPPPAIDVQASGRFVLRLPRSLHRQAAQLAEHEGTSLNQFIVSTLAEKVGAVNLYRELTQQLQIPIGVGPERQQAIELGPHRPRVSAARPSSRPPGQPSDLQRDQTRLRHPSH